MAYRSLPALVLAAAIATAGGCSQEPFTVLEPLPTQPAATQPSAVSGAEPVAEPPAEPDVPDGWIPGRFEQAWRYIVIHHSATDNGNAEQFDRMHRDQRGWDELGYHFVITNGDGGPDGDVQVGSRWRKQKWGAHCGGAPDNQYNDVGIGVCLVGNFEDHPPSDKQLASLVKLVRFLATRYEIRPDDIIGHRDAPNAVTACPGKHLQAFIAEQLPDRLELHKPKP